MNSKSILLSQCRQFKNHLLNSRINAIFPAQISSCVRLETLPYIPLLVFALTTPSHASYQEVASFSDLNQAIETANTEGDINTEEHPYIIKLTEDISLDAPLPFIESNLMILGGGHMIEGNGHRLLLIKGGHVGLFHLTLKDGVAQGGHGRDGGGGGAGLGGALFIFEGQVTAKQVRFEANDAQGGQGGPSKFFDTATGYNGGGGGFCGNGGYSTRLNSGGGGGLCGDGGDATATQGGNGGGPFGGNGGTALEPNGQPGGLGSGGGGSFYELWSQSSSNGGIGGFGGGGGGGYIRGGHGGFAGGGGAGTHKGGNGGFGGGGGTTMLLPDCGGVRNKAELDKIACIGADLGGHGGFGGGDSGFPWGGGGGAGFGGAVFIMGGQLSLDQVHFKDNSAIGGAAGFEYEIEPGQGKGGGLFICSNAEDALCQGQVDACPGSLTFEGNSASDDQGSLGDDDHVYGHITETEDACHNTSPWATDVLSTINARVGAPEQVIPLERCFIDAEDEANQLTYEIVTNTHPQIANATIDDLGQLHLTFEAKGSTEITLRATDTQGAFAEETFTVITEGNLAILKAFKAKATTAGIRLTWRTLSEIDSAGFYILRSTPGERTQVITSLIPVQGKAYQGSWYHFIDKNVVPGVIYHYQLKEMDINAQETTYANIEASW